jgi:uncharacterized protein YraI
MRVSGNTAQLETLSRHINASTFGDTAMLGRWRVSAIAVLLIAAPTMAWAALPYVTNDLHMRAGPGTEYPVVTTIPGGADIDIHGCLNDYSWCDVTWDGARGWVSANYIDYFYHDRYVYLPDYYDVLGVPVLTFELGPYWDDYYVGRFWYHRRAYWEDVWRTHPHVAHHRTPHHVVSGNVHHPKVVHRTGSHHESHVKGHEHYVTVHHHIRTSHTPHVSVQRHTRTSHTQHVTVHHVQHFASHSGRIQASRHQTHVSSSRSHGGGRSHSHAHGSHDNSRHGNRHR